MRTFTITSHVADQVAALEASSVRRRVLLKPLSWGLFTLVVLGVGLLVFMGRTQMALAVGGGGLIALVLLGVMAVAGPKERDIAIKRAGAAGEAVLPQLLRALPDTYTLLNGVPVPGARADIDHVLVGPRGIWAIEAKHHVGMVQCVGDAWGYARLGAGGIPRSGHIGNPSQQARRAAEALQRFLAQRRLPQHVQPLVVFTHPKVELTLEAPTVPIIRADEVLAFLARSPDRLAPATVDHLVDTLRKLRPLAS
ncbi:MAG: hypothetical protein CYG59_16630 [Chloroflexi bacterium]|nr:MAG: hypothetical protein CYG59_16630 [Chloroflexota bacterium]